MALTALEPGIEPSAYRTTAQDGPITGARLYSVKLSTLSQRHLSNFEYDGEKQQQPTRQSITVRLIAEELILKSYQTTPTTSQNNNFAFNSTGETTIIFNISSVGKEVQLPSTEGVRGRAEPERHRSGPETI